MWPSSENVGSSPCLSTWLVMSLQVNISLCWSQLWLTRNFLWQDSLNGFFWWSSVAFTVVICCILPSSSGWWVFECCWVIWASNHHPLMTGWHQLWMLCVLPLLSLFPLQDVLPWVQFPRWCCTVWWRTSFWCIVQLRETQAGQVLHQFPFLCLFFKMCTLTQFSQFGESFFMVPQAFGKTSPAMAIAWLCNCLFQCANSDLLAFSLAKFGFHVHPCPETILAFPALDEFWLSRWSPDGRMKYTQQCSWVLFELCLHCNGVFIPMNNSFCSMFQAQFLEVWIKHVSCTNLEEMANDTILAFNECVMFAFPSDSGWQHLSFDDVWLFRLCCAL